MRVGKDYMWNIVKEYKVQVPYGTILYGTVRYGALRYGTESARGIRVSTGPLPVICRNSTGSLPVLCRASENYLSGHTGRGEVATG